MADACCITGARRSPQPPILQGLPLMSGAHSKEPDSADILWFKNQFQARIEPALAGTPLTVVGMIIARLPGDRGSLLRSTKLSTAKISALVDMAEHIPGFTAVAARPTSSATASGCSRAICGCFSAAPTTLLKNAACERFEHTAGAVRRRAEEGGLESWVCRIAVSWAT